MDGLGINSRPPSPIHLTFPKQSKPEYSLMYSMQHAQYFILEVTRLDSQSLSTVSYCYLTALTDV